MGTSGVFLRGSLQQGTKVSPPQNPEHADSALGTCPGYSRQGMNGAGQAEASLRCVSDISWDPRIPISEDFIFFVKFPVVFTNGYCEPFFFKVGLLLFPNGCLFQNLAPKTERLSV